MASIDSAVTSPRSSPMSSPPSTTVSPTSSSPGEFVPTRRKQTRPIHRKISPFITNEENGAVTWSWYYDENESQSSVISDVNTNSSPDGKESQDQDQVITADIHPKPRSAKKLADVRFVNRSPTDAVNNNTGTYRNQNTEKGSQVARGLWSNHDFDEIEELPDEPEEPVAEPVIDTVKKKPRRRSKAFGARKRRGKKTKKPQTIKENQNNEELPTVPDSAAKIEETNVKEVQQVEAVVHVPEIIEKMPSPIKETPAAVATPSSPPSKPVSASNISTSPTSSIKAADVQETSTEKASAKKKRRNKKNKQQTFNKTETVEVKVKTSSDLLEKPFSDQTPKVSKKALAKNINLTAEELDILNMFNEVDAADLSRSPKNGSGNSSQKSAVQVKKISPKKQLTVQVKDEDAGRKASEPSDETAKVENVTPSAEQPADLGAETLVENSSKKKKKKKKKHKKSKIVVEQQIKDEVISTPDQPVAKKRRMSQTKTEGQAKETPIVDGKVKVEGESDKKDETSTKGSISKKKRKRNKKKKKASVHTEDLMPIEDKSINVIEAKSEPPSSEPSTPAANTSLNISVATLTTVTPKRTPKKKKVPTATLR